jgi:hypothetical protein
VSVALALRIRSISTMKNSNPITSLPNELLDNIISNRRSDRSNQFAKSASPFQEVNAPSAPRAYTSASGPDRCKWRPSKQFLLGYRKRHPITGIYPAFEVHPRMESWGHVDEPLSNLGRERTPRNLIHGAKTTYPHYHLKASKPSQYYRTCCRTGSIRLFGNACSTSHCIWVVSVFGKL